MKIVDDEESSDSFKITFYQNLDFNLFSVSSRYISYSNYYQSLNIIVYLYFGFHSHSIRN